MILRSLVESVSRAGSRLGGGWTSRRVAGPRVVENTLRLAVADLLAAAARC
jgi:hypothetical protein